MLARGGAGLTDGQLLADYVSRRDASALAVLVQRHGAMVWGVCRRVLGNHHDAEDAFQATFLVLVRKAATIASPELLANWLYGVAHQTAMKARATVGKRRVREKQVTDMPEPAVVQRGLWNDLQPLLDQELSRLRDIHRVVIVLCDLEGKTRKEAARHLGLPEGTVGSRLARARALLAKRLAQRGVVLSAGALAAVLVRNVASAGVPNAVVTSTISAAGCYAAGQAAASGMISPKVVTLAEGVLKTMLMSKLKTAFTLLLAIGILGLAGGGVLLQTRAKAQELVLPGELDDGKPMADLSGTWQGDDWGTVILRRAKDGAFEGTYTDTFGKDVGRIAVKWSAASKRYEGTWGEGKFRFGRIALEAPRDGKTISGAWTTDPNCEHQPGVPSLASLRWRRADLAAASQAEKLKQIGLAMQAYFDQYQTYPGPAVYGKDGKPLLSWRVALLPYLNHGDLYEQFRLDEPWDSAHNKKLLAKMPTVYRGPGDKDDAATPFQVFVGKGTMFEGPKGLGYRDIPDGISYTIAVVEAATIVPWTKPEDLPYSAIGRIPELGGESPDVTYALFADGKVHALKRQFDPDALRVAITRDDGIPTPFDKLLAPGTRSEDDAKAESIVEQDKEGITAWGKEVGGLQAGLGYRPGKKRTYAHGETVALVVRLRNVSKQEVKFHYDKELFMLKPPTVTDAAGRPVRLGGEDTFGSLVRVPRQVSLAPGKVIELAEWKPELRPASEKGEKDPHFSTLYGTGKFLIHYKQLTHEDTDPTLAKLATGKLELEVRSSPQR